jgi:hypothetical protein
METREFKNCNVKYAAQDQDEDSSSMQSIAGFMRHDGNVTFCFELDEDEIIDINASKLMWITMHTNGVSMQPIWATTLPPNDIDGIKTPDIVPTMEILRVKSKAHQPVPKTHAQSLAMHLFDALNSEDVSVHEFTTELNKLFI